MDFLNFREPMNAWTHGGWMLLCLPACLFLHLRAGKNLLKQVSIALFTIGLIGCFTGSCLYHAVRLSPAEIEACAMIDQVSIYALIAGTTTPVVVVLLDGPWRVGSLLMMWAIAALGITLRATRVPIPSAVTTGSYILMGWTGMVFYIKLMQRVPQRSLALLWIGGLLYSLGAVVNEVRWPNWAPGVFGAHELHHFCAMGGSLCHFLFMWKVVAPFTPEPSAECVPLAAEPELSTA